MIKKSNGEIWKTIVFTGQKSLRKKYAVSSFGRLASFTTNLDEDGKLLKGSLTSGYKTINLHLDQSSQTLYIHREVARLFCKKKSPKYKYVIHINHKKEDNKFTNLQWATLEEMAAHQQKSPAKIAFKKRQASATVGLKLNEAKVRKIKETIANPKRKLTFKQLAAKYDVSEMTLYRIKSGENWGHIK